MKKTVSILLTLLLILGMTACAGTPVDNSPSVPAPDPGPATQPSAPPAAEAPSSASTFPSERAIKIVVPYDAGGGLDISSRILASTATETLDQRIDVVCMSGANGQEGIQFVYNQPTDGYTILAADYGPMVSPVLKGEVDTYKLDDWIPIIEMNEVVPTFFVKADSPYQTMQELIDAAKAKPGTISVAHGRYLSIPHLPLILLEQESGASFNHVPTSGGAEALTFVLGGNVDVGGSVPSTVASGVKSGDLRALAVASDQRVAAFPDVPTLKELGYDVVLPSWYMYFVKKGTPADVIATLEKGLMDALLTDTAVKMAAASSIEITNLNSADSLTLYNSMNEKIKVILDTVE